FRILRPVGPSGGLHRLSKTGAWYRCSRLGESDGGRLARRRRHSLLAGCSRHLHRSNLRARTEPSALCDSITNVTRGPSPPGTMRWRRLGLCFQPDGRLAWMRTHASTCVALPSAGEQIRVYFSSRDSENRSSIGFIELDLGDPTRILRLSESPVLSPGERGSFDDS